MLWTQLKSTAAVVLVAGTLLATGATVAAVHAGKGPGESHTAPGSADRAEQTQVVRSLSYDNYNLVHGETTILSILPANVRVKKGQLVCELDPAGLKSSLAFQQTKTKRAEANYSNARLSREVAEIAVKEYTEGILQQDQQTILGELKLAVSDLSRSVDRVEWASRMHAKGYVTKEKVTAEDLRFRRLSSRSSKR